MAAIVPTSLSGISPSSEFELHTTRATMRNNPRDDGFTEGILNERQIRQLKALVFAVGPSSEFAHNKEYPSSLTAFAYATGSSDHAGFTREDTIPDIRIPTNYVDAIDFSHGKDY